MGIMKNKNLMVVVLVLIAATLIWLLRPNEPQEHFGLWSLLPALVTIVFCFATRNVIFALLIGVFVGGLVSGQLNVIKAF